MASLVSELQRKARDPNFPISELLMDAKRVAKRINYTEFDNWLNNELNGYGTSKVPDYRKVDCNLEYARISTGEWCNLDLIGERFSSMTLDQPIGEISTYPKDKVVYLNVSRETLNFLKKNMSNTNFRVGVDSNQIKRIIDNVRHKILDLAMELETEGILTEEIILPENGMKIPNYSITKDKHEVVTVNKANNIQNVTKNNLPIPLNENLRNEKSSNIIITDSKNVIIGDNNAQKTADSKNVITRNSSGSNKYISSNNKENKNSGDYPRLKLIIAASGVIVTALGVYVTYIK